MKALKTSLICLLIAIFSFLFFACSKNIPLESLSFTKSEVNLFLGNSTYLQLQLSPDNANYYKIEFSSSRPEIATINQRGKVTSKSYGETIITAKVKDSDIKAECKVIVDDGQIFKIDVNTDYAITQYYQGQSFCPDGLAVTAYYESGKTKTLTQEQYQIFAPETLTSDTKITITYQDFTTSFDVTVLPDIETGITITKQPTKTSYYVGEKFDKSGMEVCLNYASGKTQIITDYSIQETINYDTIFIKITYGQFEAIQEISANAKIVIYDISLLQTAINNAKDGDSIMIREGTYNTSTGFTIPASKKIIIYGETQDTSINAYNTTLFAITDDNTNQCNITLARLTLTLAQGENISLITYPQSTPPTLVDVVYQ